MTREIVASHWISGHEVARSPAVPAWTGETMHCGKSSQKQYTKTKKTLLAKRVIHSWQVLGPNSQRSALVGRARSDARPSLVVPCC